MEKKKKPNFYDYLKKRLQKLGYSEEFVNYASATNRLNRSIESMEGLSKPGVLNSSNLFGIDVVFGEAQEYMFCVQKSYEEKIRELKTQGREETAEFYQDLIEIQSERLKKVESKLSKIVDRLTEDSKREFDGLDYNNQRNFIWCLVDGFEKAEDDIMENKEEYFPYKKTILVHMMNSRGPDRLRDVAKKLTRLGKKSTINELFEL